MHQAQTAIAGEGNVSPVCVGGGIVLLCHLIVSLTEYIYLSTELTFEYLYFTVLYCLRPTPHIFFCMSGVTLAKFPRTLNENNSAHFTLGVILFCIYLLHYISQTNIVPSLLH